MLFCCLILILLPLLALYKFMKLDCNPILAFYERFLPNKNKLQNKTVFIAGASTGIGEELAYQLAELNCRLVLTSTTESKLQDVKQNCIKRSNNSLKSDDILVMAYDITDYKKNESNFEQIIEKFGDIDILVCNAAKVMVGKVLDDDFEQVKRLFEINLFSHVHLSKMIVKHWMQNKTKDKIKKLDKRIIATSSIAAYTMLPFGSFYTGSKQAFNSFYRDLSMQHQQDGIAVSIICPGFVVSNIVQNQLSKNKRGLNTVDLKEMSTSRCCELMIIATANKLNESWIALQPFLGITYITELMSYYLCLLVRTFNLSGHIESRFFRN